MIDLPHNTNAERAVLGALMISPAALLMIGDWLPEDAFFRADHRVIYRAITELAAKGQAHDGVTMGEWFEAQCLGDLIGDDGCKGTSYVYQLANNTPSAANVVAYAEIVLEHSRLRSAIEIGETLQTAAMQPRAVAGDVISNASQSLAQLQNNTTRGGLVVAKTGVKEWYAEFVARYETGAKVTGLPTPWKDLNDATHGYQDGELIVLAARPNMGKSVAGDMQAIFTAIRCDAADAGAVALFALESTRAKVIRRGVACIGDVPHEWLIAPSADADDSEVYCARSTNAAGILTKARLLIDDTPSLTVHQIVARARRANLQQRLRLVVIDHMHIIRLPGKNRVQELGEVSRTLKALAKELSCPVIALAQLSRGVAGRTDKRPTMTDLRDSGEIEQDADLIMFLHREDYYDAETHLRGVVELSVGKGRDVPTGTTIHLKNEYQCMRLADWEGPLPVAMPNSQSESRGGFRRNGT